MKNLLILVFAVIALGCEKEMRSASLADNVETRGEQCQRFTDEQLELVGTLQTFQAAKGNNHKFNRQYG